MNVFSPRGPLLLALLACLSCTQLRAEAVNLEFADGNSSTVTAPGIKLTLSDISDFKASSTWKLTAFTWLSTRRSGSEPTGRGYLLIFDAAKFDPSEKPHAQVSSEITGLIAVSSSYADGEYAFPDDVILERGKSYYILNSVPITTERNPTAPHQYGFDATGANSGIERWTGTETGWGPASLPGCPNFKATFTPAPEPATTP